MQEYLPGIELSLELAKRQYESELESKFLDLRPRFERLTSEELPYPPLTEMPITAIVVLFKKVDETYELILNESPYITNTVNQTRNSLNHAEKVAIEKAQKNRLRFQRKHLSDCILLTTVEPCAMCTEAFLHVGGKGIIFGLSQKDLRGKYIFVNGVYKPFRTEPEGYSAEKFLQERNSNMFVHGGYMKEEIWKRMEPFTYLDGEYIEDKNIL